MKKRIMVVEDEMRIGETIAMCLLAMGYRMPAIVLGGGTAMMTLEQDAAKEFSLLFIERDLRDSDTSKVITFCRVHRPDIRIVVSSEGFIPQANPRVYAEQLGSEAILPKPFLSFHLFAAIQASGVEQSLLRD